MQKDLHMNTKTYTVAGVSTLNGTTKPRFSNDFEKRLFMLEYTGHENIAIVELPNAMTKMEAVEHLKTLPAFQNETAMSALEAFTAKNTPKAAGKRGRPMKLPTLADVPTHGEGGKFLSKETRLQMLDELIAETIAKKEAQKAKIAARAAAKAAAGDTVAAEAAAAEAEDEADDIEQDDPVAEDAAEAAVA
jgi:hypothetical protein